jgi:hypothetical protein
MRRAGLGLFALLLLVSSSHLIGLQEKQWRNHEDSGIAPFSVCLFMFRSVQLRQIRPALRL